MESADEVNGRTWPLPHNQIQGKPEALQVEMPPVELLHRKLPLVLSK